MLFRSAGEAPGPEATPGVLLRRGVGRDVRHVENVFGRAHGEADGRIALRQRAARLAVALGISLDALAGLAEKAEPGKGTKKGK